MKIDKNYKILLWTVPIALLALVSVRAEEMDQREIAFPFLVAISWACVLSRYYHLSLNSSTIFLAISWFLGFVGLYGALWVSFLDIEVFRRAIQLEIIGVFGYISYDYLRLNEQKRYRTAVSAGLILLIIYFVWFNVFKYKLPFERIDDLAQVAVVLIALMVGISYWMTLGQKSEEAGI